MGNILIYIIFALEVVIGVSSSLYIIGSLFFTIFKKLARKIRYGASMYD